MIFQIEMGNKVDDYLTKEWQSLDELVKRTGKSKPSVLQRLCKLRNNWNAVEVKHIPVKGKHSLVSFYRIKDADGKLPRP